MIWMANILAYSLRLEKLFFTSAWSAVFSSCTAQCQVCHVQPWTCCVLLWAASPVAVGFAACESVLLEPPHFLNTSAAPGKAVGSTWWLLSSLAALQSPIEYQRKENSSAVLRPQAGRVPQPNARPHSSIPVGSEKPLKATSRNPSLPPLKISTSNGSTGYEHSQPGDKYEQSKVLSSSDKTWSHSPFLIPQVIRGVSLN